MKTRSRVLIAAIFLFATAWVLTPSVVHFFGQEVLNKLHEQGARVRVDGLTGTRVGLTAEVLESWISVPLDGRNKAFPVSLKIDNPSASVKLPLLSPWAPEVVFRGGSYSGAIDGSLPLVGALLQRPTLNLLVTDVDLSLHPQARAFGVEAGTLNARLHQHPLQGLPNAEAHYSLQIKELEVELPPMVAQVARLTSLTDASLDAAATLKPSGSFSLNQCVFRSSLGVITVTAHGTLTESSVKDARGTLLFDLSGEQGATVRPWIGLLVPAARLPSDGPIQCEYRLGPCSGPSATQLRLGSACVRLECGG